MVMCIAEASRSFWFRVLIIAMFFCYRSHGYSHATIAFMKIACKQKFMQHMSALGVKCHICTSMWEDLWED